MRFGLILSRITRVFALTVISLLPLPNCLAQNQTITFEHFNHEDGLSAPVTKIVQDSIGFLWLGTTDGLNRFDGKNFVVYRSIAGDTTALLNNIVNDLCIDGKGRVWVATNGGLCYYNFSNDSFYPVAYDAALEKIDRHRVHAVANARKVSNSPAARPVAEVPLEQGTAFEGIWFATRTHVHLWNEDRPVESFAVPGEHELSIKYLYEDIRNRLWIGTNDFLFVFDRMKDQIFSEKVTSPFTIEKQLNATVHPIIPYRGDTLLIGSWYGGVHKVLYDNDSIELIHIPDLVESDPRKHVVRGMCRWYDNYFWVGTYGNGLSVLDAATGHFIRHFHADPSDEKSLSTDYIFDVFTDKSGTLWIGNGDGLDKYDPLTRQFTSVVIPAGSGEFSIYRLPRTITEDRLDPEWLWLTVSGIGLFHFNPVSGQFVLYHHDPADPGSLPDNVVHSFYYDHLGRIWLGTASGLCTFDPHSQTFRRITLPGAFQPKGVHEILQDSNDVFWFATNHNGVFMYDESRSETRSYVYRAADRNSLPDNRIFSLLIDRKGFIWIGTQNRGLCRLDPGKEEFLFFEHKRSDLHSLSDNGVYDLHEDEHGHLWIATENGLTKMDLRDFSINNYTTSDGLCNNVIFSIEPDQYGNFWLATYNGLSRFDPVSRTFKNYYVHDGLPSNSISGALYCAPDGTFYFGSSGMITYCRPGMMKMNRHIPPVVITGFRIFDQPATIHRNGHHLLPMHLSYHDNMITFDFTALNFTNAMFNRYMYKLEGFNDQWIDCGYTQSATFTNLDGGTYTFRVKAANNDGLWNEMGTQVTLIVHPPYWSTWWFYLLCVCAIAGILYIAYRFRVHQLLKLQQIRTRISRDLHDDIGSTLSSINMLSSMATHTLPPDKKSTDVFQTISSASREAMELMSDIVWSINPGNDRMEMITIRMRQYASEILEAARIGFTIEVDDASNLVSLPIEHRKDFYLIFKEAINNIAKYSRADNAVISLRTALGKLHLQISDDGIGFDTEAVFAGNGLKNMKARAAQLNGELSISSQSGQGTKIRLSIPAP